MRGKTIFLALCAAAAVNAFCGGGYAYAEAAAEYAGGNGTEASPYLIENASQLELLRNTVNSGDDLEGKYFELTDDIDLGGSLWTPIGTEDYGFKGRFDGVGYTVSGLNVKTEDYAGLFGFIDRAEISYLTVSGTVSGKKYVGGIAGYNENSAITHCSNSCTVDGESYVGGIAGGSYNDALIENCCNTGAVTGTSERAGGMAGYTSGKVQYCYNYAQVTGGTAAGGVAGNAGSGADVDCCYYLDGTASSAIGGKQDFGGRVRALDAEQFAVQDNFASWDFENIWVMSGTLKRPVFRTDARVKKYFAGVFDAHNDVPPAVAFYADITAGTYTVTGIDWSVELGDYNASPTDEEKYKTVNISAGTTVRYGIVVSVGESGADADSLTAELLKITPSTAQGGVSE